jgi:hypothetical protein
VTLNILKITIVVSCWRKELLLLLLTAAHVQLRWPTTIAWHVALRYASFVMRSRQNLQRFALIATAPDVHICVSIGPT